MTARENINAQLEHLQSKYAGTGHADTSKYEWMSTIHRDSIASYIGHPGLIGYFAIAEHNAIGRQKFHLLEKMFRPVGPQPPQEEE
eukprot:TRINITY_DN136439_c0_g1_i1.p1 TRINITY_DN136439_c0_g1~~TRINITY_DN136439_c0_g1_i1.p1  ORF type:complete len:86 (-),score=22.02 TRINITY_DN136439_c0_g1_i1:81-338(-)